MQVPARLRKACWVCKPPTFLGLALLVVLTACAPARPSPGSSEPAASSNGAASTGPQALTIVNSNEPLSIQGFAGTNANRGSGLILAIVHSSLTAQDEHGVYQPQLAAQGVSAESGTWRLNPDGSMDVTWKLRPNVQWQDGAPFTSSDMLFTFNLKKDPLYPSVDAAVLALMASATAPDPTTFVVHWANPYWAADAAQGLVPLPEHLLAEPYARGDPEAFINSPFFTSDFIGLGPYRLTRWERGSEMDYARFDGYFLGRRASTP